MSFVLASGSPRRRELLLQLGLEFEVAPVDADESTRVGEPAMDYVRRVAMAKFQAACARSDASVLVADTTVHVDGAIYGKPESAKHAAEVLLSLSGSSHQVTTAFVAGRPEQRVVEDVTSTVHFRVFDAELVARYVATGEGVDKAGGYAIQGIGAGLIERLEGSYTNVVGLPLERVLPALLQVRAVAQWPLVPA